MRRCISSTGNLYAYSYPNEQGNSGSSNTNNGSTGSSSTSSSTGAAGGHSPIPITRAGTPPLSRRGMHSLATSPGSLHAFHAVMTPPMNSPRGGQCLPLPPFERTWGEDVVRVVCISGT